MVRDMTQEELEEYKDLRDQRDDNPQDMQDGDWERLSDLHEKRFEEE